MYQRVARTLRYRARLINQQTAHSIEEGAALDAGGEANLLEASVRAAADATAAAQVAQPLAAAEEVVDGEHELATPARETRAPVRAEEIEEILAAAAERDSRAELRDRVADERERAASLRSFLGDQRYEEYEQHAAGLPVRRAAAMDRLDAKTDRASAASDRAQLSAQLRSQFSAQPSPGSGDGGFSRGARMSEVAAELSHDLRVPLSSMMASVEMLEDELREPLRRDPRRAAG